MGAGLAAAAVAMLCVGAMPAAHAQVKGGRPNVVVIETDDQTVQSMWAMPIVQSLLGNEGTTFDNSFVSFPLCCPSRATFLTGQYAHNHGVFDNQLPYGSYYRLDSTNTLPVWLQAAGYRTMMLGKYLNAYGSRYPNEVPPGWSDWHVSVERTTYNYYGFTLNENGRLVAYPPNAANYQTDVYSRKASELIAQAAPGPRPFFLWTAFVAPHFTLARTPEPDDPRRFPTPTPAPQDRNRFASEALPMPPGFDEHNVTDKPATVRYRPRLSGAALNAIRENYQQELETLQAVDRGVGQIVATLRRTGQLDNTLIVFTSDNGYFYGEHRIAREKVLPYEPSARVPLIMRGPGIPRGRHLSQLVSNQDLAPTILDATHVAPGRVEDGTSLLRLTRHRMVEPGRDLLLEGLLSNFPLKTFAGIRTPHWFYAEYSNGDRELYDLVADPYELVNRDLNPSYAGIEATLARRLAGLRTCSGQACLAHPRLRVRLRYRTGTTRAGRPCAASAVQVSLRGPDRSRLTGLDLYVDGTRLGVRAARPFRFRIARDALRHRTVAVRPVAYLSEDQAYTPFARVRVCGRGRNFAATAESFR